MKRPFWRSLTGRLTLAFVLMGVLSLLLVGVLSYVSVREGYRQLTTDDIQANLTERLQQYYQAHGSLTGYGDVRDGPGGPAASPTPGAGQDDPSGQGRPPPGTKADGRPGGEPPGNEGGPFRVLDAQYRLLGGAHLVWPSTMRRSAIPVDVGSVRVAYLIPTGHYPPLDTRSAEFLVRTRQAILAAMLVAGLLALGLGLLLSRTLLLPLRQLLGGIESMQRGQPVQVQPSSRNDELDELLRAFHAMTQTVQRNQQARRQLTADIAHDLNTPLSVISGSLEAMLAGVFTPDHPRLARLYREALHASVLVRDLRFLALADAGELHLTIRKTDIGQLIIETVQDLQENAVQKEITLTCVVPTEPLQVWLDPVRMVQVLHNLLSNALTHAETGDRVAVGAQRDASGLQITVQDTGSGISPAELPFVFDRLYRADSARSEQGSGLGLSISHSIVVAHGGSIQISSALDEGTTVTIQLPIQQDAELT